MPDISSPPSLPVWDMPRHFKWSSWKDEDLPRALEELSGLSESFSSSFKGHLSSKLEEAIKALDKVTNLKYKLMSFVMLEYDVQQQNEELAKFKSSMEGQLAKLEANHFTFFPIELASLSEEDINKQMTPALEFYLPFVRDVRKRRPHMLSDEVERGLTVRAPWSSSDPVVEYYMKRLSAAMFKFREEELNLEKVLSKLSSPDWTVRRDALKAINDGLGSQHIHQFAALSLNLVTGSSHIENEERNFKSLRASRNLDNDVPDEVVDSLLLAVRGKGVELAKRYYKMKKEILKKTSSMKVFTWSDRNAPLSLTSKETIYSWQEAVEIVSQGYLKFSKTMQGLFLRQIDEGRVHVPPLDGKRSGAYCSQNTPSIGPFQLLNYVGTPNDVATLAHESGHGAHFFLSGEQGILQFNPPLTLAETASIFGEMIVFRDLLGKCSTDEERLTMLLEKIDSIVNSVVRQCSFDRFEELLHSNRGNGVLGDGEFKEFWMKATKEYYGEEGEVFDHYNDMDHLWAYVSHFHASPFYVYSYAFADLVVGALYDAYVKKPDGFEDNLINLLKAGGTKNFVELLKPFDLFPNKPEFWETSLNVHLGSLIDEAEKLSKALKFTAQ